MILHDANKYPALAEYGIEIPVFPSNVERALDELRSDPMLAEREEEWLVPMDDTELSRADLELVHESSYLDKLYSAEVEQEVIKTYELVDRNGQYHRYDPQKASRSLSGLFGRAVNTASGTVQCMRHALERGSCFFTAGGMHHGKRNTGDGFCLINDVVIAPRVLQRYDAVNTVWIIDLDAHKGDGTAALTEGDTSIRTLSAHMAAGWPLDRERYRADGSLHPSFTPSDIDIPIASGEEAQYLPELREGLAQLERFGYPDIALVLYGADAYERDELPSAQHLRLTKEQIAERDTTVYRFLRERGIPRAYVRAGGYGRHVWEVLTQFLDWYLYLEYT